MFEEPSCDIKWGFEKKMNHIFFSFFDSSLTVRTRRRKKKMIKIITVIIMEVISFKVFILKLFMVKSQP